MGGSTDYNPNETGESLLLEVCFKAFFIMVVVGLIVLFIDSVIYGL